MLSKLLPILMVCPGQACTKPEKITQPTTFYCQEEENPLLNSFELYEKEGWRSSLYLQAIKIIEYECGLVSFDNIYIKKKEKETDHEKIMRESKNSQIFMCKSAMKNTDDLKSILHYKKILETIHKHPNENVQENINNLYSYHKARISYSLHS